jgi:hypothetical protein
MTRSNYREGTSNPVEIDHLEEPIPLERSLCVWHCYHVKDDAWEGEQFFLGEIENDLYRAMEMASTNYVSIEYGWQAGDDHVDEAPDLKLSWEIITPSRWRLMNYGRFTDVVLQRTDVWGTRAA